MSKGCCESLSRCILIITNLILLVCGIAIAVASPVVAHNLNKNWPDSVNHVLNQLVQIGVVGTPLLIVGIVIVVIALIGLLGALKRIRFLLCVYMLLASLIVIFQCVLSFFLMGDISKIPFFGKELEKAIDDVLKPEWTDDDKRRVWVDTFGCKDEPTTSAFEQCKTTIFEQMSQPLGVLGGVALGVAIFELVVLILTLIVFHKAKK